VLLNRIFVAKSGSTSNEIEHQASTGDGQQHEIHSRHWLSSLAPAITGAQAEIGDGRMESPPVTLAQGTPLNCRRGHRRTAQIRTTLGVLLKGAQQDAGAARSESATVRVPSARRRADYDPPPGIAAT